MIICWPAPGCPLCGPHSILSLPYAGPWYYTGAHLGLDPYRKNVPIGWKESTCTFSSRGSQRMSSLHKKCHIWLGRDPYRKNVILEWGEFFYSKDVIGVGRDQSYFSTFLQDRKKRTTLAWVPYNESNRISSKKDHPCLGSLQKNVSHWSGEILIVFLQKKFTGQVPYKKMSVRVGRVYLYFY